jgi:SAM-dependent methyltransferase
MDPKTSKYYSTRVKDAFDLYKTSKTRGISKYFATTFPRGSRVLDIGAGSGRDMLKLLEAGYDAWGIDASAEMVDRAVAENSRLSERLIVAFLPTERPFFETPFDGILCSAVMMHIPDEHVFDAAYSLRANLKEKGKLLFSVPLSRDDLDEEGRCPDGRLFKIRPPEYYDLLFERIGFRKINSSVDNDALGRKGVKWWVAVYELESSSGTRSIDKIESMIQ